MRQRVRQPTFNKKGERKREGRGILRDPSPPYTRPNLKQNKSQSVHTHTHTPLQREGMQATREGKEERPASVLTDKQVEVLSIMMRLVCSHLKSAPEAETTGDAEERAALTRRERERRIACDILYFSWRFFLFAFPLVFGTKENRKRLLLSSAHDATLGRGGWVRISLTSRCVPV